MTTGENPRVRQTRQRLEGALLRLLQVTPLHAVSIRELCSEAGINRTTFYNHYGSQYELLNEISRRFLGSIAEQLDSADYADRESVHQRVRMVLDYIQENRALAILLINNNVDPGFAERIFSLPKINDLLEAALNGCHDEHRRAATVSFVIQGSYKLLQEWINQENRLPPAAQTELMLSLAQRVCSEV